MSYRNLSRPIPTVFYEKQSEIDSNDYGEFFFIEGGKLGKDILLASPGGLSDKHHWSGGFYSDRGSSTDKFIGKNSDPYLSGEFGNLYSATQNTQENDSFELLPFTKLDPIVLSQDKPQKIQYPSKLWILGGVGLIISLSIIFSLWGNTTLLISKYINNNKSLSISKSLSVSIIVTIIFAIIFLFVWKE